MCGISVIISKNRDYLTRIDAMTDVVNHRGPDASGFFEDGNIAMGHRRLKIIDLSDDANQPMEFDGVYIVFNGEIYNYKYLRDFLIVKGHTFNTNSDTEVILHLYSHFRYDINMFIRVLNGMFAFVIYDSKIQNIIAVRDRFGIKPLYYSETEDSIIFASEIKQFLELPEWNPSIREYNKTLFLESALVDTNDGTMLNEVYQIPPGHYVITKQDPYSWCVIPWYDLAENVQATTDTSTFLTIQWLLKCSVEAHLQADVPVGSCLSGGIDSTSIVCMVNRIKKNQKQITVTNRATDPKIDEGKWVDIVQQYCDNLERYDVWPGEDIFKVLPQIVYHQDSPIPTSSMYAQWCVFQEASHHVKVMLDGQGADETFGGYHMYHGVRLAYLLKHARVPTALREFWNLYRDPHVDIDFVSKCAVSNLRGSGGIRGYSLRQITETSLPALLHWEDRNSMAHSVEARVPFLDHTLVEHTVALPDEMKVSNGVTKVILREAMKDIIPEQIRLRRDKIGFFTPEQQWFDQYREEFKSRFISAKDHLPKNIFDQCIEILHGKKQYNSVLWRAITYGEFVKQFGVL